MHLRAEWLLLALPFALPAAELPYFHVMARDPGAWPQVLESIGYQPQDAAAAHILVARPGAPASAAWRERVEKGAILVLEGESPLAESFGFKRGKRSVLTTSLRDVHRPTLPIVWEKPLELPVMDLPANATVFAREKWTNAPMTAGIRLGSGAVLWVAASLGEHGFERFPYVVAALADLGLEMPFRTSRLWAFFDSAYRSRVDLDYFAARWRKSGIAALHVAAWHFYEPDAERDEYLKRLIEACHREGILVYAWLELPHVSEKFWDDHPEWREKTAVLQDAQLDWRKLMNLANRDCFRAASEGVKRLISRFEWDGVNLAELYFESLEGIGESVALHAHERRRASRVQRALRLRPDRAVWSAQGRSVATGVPRLSRRVGTAHPTGVAGRTRKPARDEAGSRPGADACRRPLRHRHARRARRRRRAPAAAARQPQIHVPDRGSGHRVEPWPATLSRRSPNATRPLTPHRGQSGDRHQHRRSLPETSIQPSNKPARNCLNWCTALGAAFARVALYFENSLLPPDLGLLPSPPPRSPVRTHRAEDRGRVVHGGRRYVARGAALVDGQFPGPQLMGRHVWLPAGSHTVEAAATLPAPSCSLLTGDLKSARISDAGRDQLLLRSPPRAPSPSSIRVPQSVEVDGEAFPAKVRLPRSCRAASIWSQLVTILAWNFLS